MLLMILGNVLLISAIRLTRR